MAVLLIAEISGGELALDATAKALTAAKAMGDVTVLCAAAGCRSEFATDLGPEGSGENGCIGSKAEEQLVPQIDVRRLAARHAAAVLALQPPSANVECAAWPARQSTTISVSR